MVKGKTDAYMKGRDVLIAKTGLPTCPVNMLNRYLNLASIENTSQVFIFSPIYLSKSENVYKLLKSCQLSYTRSSEITLSAHEGIWLDKTKFGLHSVRSGGARAAAAAGIDDRLFKNLDVGRVTRRKTVMLRNLLRTDYLFQKNVGI